MILIDCGIYIIIGIVLSSLITYLIEEREREKIKWDLWNEIKQKKMWSIN